MEPAQLFLCCISVDEQKTLLWPVLHLPSISLQSYMYVTCYVLQRMQQLEPQSSNKTLSPIKIKHVHQ